ncbi:MAG: nuclease A inhibitor family protein [Pyrinomonadaceae bacterium]
MMSDEQLIHELERATEGLLFMSESDYPFEVVRLESLSEEDVPQRLRRLAGADTAAPVETRSVEDFFRVAAAEAEWKDAQALETAKRYQALLSLLKENLTDVRVYRVGEINIPVYIIGRSSEGRLLGLSTRVVET